MRRYADYVANFEAKWDAKYLKKTAAEVLRAKEKVRKTAMKKDSNALGAPLVQLTLENIDPQSATLITKKVQFSDVKLLEINKGATTIHESVTAVGELVEELQNSDVRNQEPESPRMHFNNI